MSRALIDLTDEEIAEQLRKVSTHVMFAYDALMAERDRRSADRQARSNTLLTQVVAAASVVSTIIAVVALVRS